MPTTKTTKKTAVVKKTTEKKIAVKKSAEKKPTVKKTISKPETKLSAKKESQEIEIKIPAGKYFETVGRRKSARARVRLFTQNKKDITVNGRPYEKYFPVFTWQKIVESPLEKLNCLGKFGVNAQVSGGGVSAQAEAVRHAISRALVLLNPYFKKRLRKSGYLTRDPRMRERKKFGLKRARRAPQWSKR